MSEIEIAGRAIGHGRACWIVAELGGNAARSYDTAVRLIHAAKKAGADAIKTQCFTPDSMTLPLETEPFMVTWQGRRRSLYDLYRETAMPMGWHASLKALAESLGMAYFASVFDREGVDYMDGLAAPAFKISSFELVDTRLIRYASSKGKPLILSTGMATEAEITDALWKAHPYNTPSYPCAVLKCSSAYPASPAEINLRTIVPWQHSFIKPWPGITVGLSDHTLGIAVPVAAVVLGASIIEKHLCLRRADGGQDAPFSLEPAEFQAMVESVRTAEAALGEMRYGPTESEREMVALRRSLWIVRDVRVGELFSAGNLRTLRPAGGLAPAHYDDVIGRRAARDCRAGEAMTWEMVEP